MVAAGLLIQPLWASGLSAREASRFAILPGADGFTLPDLGYAFNALLPSIDAMTMEIHHDKHHAGYVKNLNAAVTGSAFVGMSLEEIMAKVAATDTAVRNNGGGHYNHSLFWKAMSPTGGGMPEGKLAKAIDKSFGSFEEFKTQFSKAAGTVFGSGWAWLKSNPKGELSIISTPNQDNPLMVNIVQDAGYPILGLDVWEHAYYLNYQNKRADYIAAFFNVIDWKEASERYKAATSK